MLLSKHLIVCAAALATAVPLDGANAGDDPPAVRDGSHDFDFDVGTWMRILWALISSADGVSYSSSMSRSASFGPAPSVECPLIGLTRAVSSDQVSRVAPSRCVRAQLLR